MWFVYTLISLYLLAPFLQKMLEKLNNNQITGMLLGMFFFGRIINVLKTLGFEIGIPISIIGDCSLFFFIFGYWIYHINIKVSFKLLIPIGIVNILYSAYTFSNQFLVNGASNLALGMVIGVVVYYTIFSKMFNHIKQGKATDIITFISTRTYGIYLIHMLIFQIFSSKKIMMLSTYNYINFWVLPVKCFVIFIISLIIAIFMDILICDPLFKGFNYLWEKANAKICSMKNEK